MPAERHCPVPEPGPPQIAGALRWRAVRRAGLLVLAFIAAGCFISRSTRVDSETFGSDNTVTIRTPMRAHLLDGSVVVYRDGATVGGDTIRGAGIHRDPLLNQVATRNAVPLDSVVGVESFRTTVNTGRTMMYSALTTIVTVPVVLAIAKAIFGSCPTFYSDSGDTVALEAEGFSYSISSLLEARDVDRLRAQPDSHGTLRLQVWNEALETHYINHLELIETRHRPGEFVLPDQRGRPVAVGGELRAARVSDGSGRDVSALLREADGQVFSSDESRLASATLEQLDDWIEIVAPRPATDSVAIVLRLRNSLLNTVLFYDHMLALPGARSLDWLAGDLERIASTAELGRWYAAHFGLRAQVMVDGEWRTVERLADQGPIAWRDAAFVVAVPPGDSLRVRLTFLVDEWRIDRVWLAASVRRPDMRTVPLARVDDHTGAPMPDALELLGAADEDYLQTMPRDRFTASFETGHAKAGESRTFLLVSQGYYTEWVRGQWLKEGGGAPPFQPGDSTILRVVQSWAAQKDTMEKQFHTSRIPVR